MILFSSSAIEIFGNRIDCSVLFLIPFLLLLTLKIMSRKCIKRYFKRNIFVEHIRIRSCKVADGQTIYYKSTRIKH